MHAIKTVSLTKYYGKHRGISDVSLTVDEGEFFGFIGPNGAGKSTSIRALLGLIRPSSGSAEIFGKSIPSCKAAILSEIGYLPSEAVFYAGMRVWDVIQLSAKLRKADCLAHAQKLCERLCLDTSKKIRELSFGNRKKVGIVCALQASPRLCILDEPTSGLDPFMQQEFFTILKEMHAQGMTIFLSSHILPEIQKNCTQAAIIREGRIIACGSIESLSQASAKRIHVQGNINLGMLTGCQDIHQDGSGVSFLYSGDMDHLIQALSRQHITDLSICEPDLEEIFLHYYES